MGEGRGCGIWEDLACRRTEAVGSRLDVGDESLIMTEVIERNSFSWEILGGCVELL